MEAHPLPVFHWSEWEMERLGIWHDTNNAQGSEKKKKPRSFVHFQSVSVYRCGGESGRRMLAASSLGPSR
ncbi:hypothetical protein BC826DRAFT_1082507 [Russula brevipes]|nr:hypothetical protein BC826DRAFT_1082507 [Russula brevipes]